MLHRWNEVKLIVRVEGYSIWKWLISHRTTCPCITFKTNSIFTERSVQHLFSRPADDEPQVVQERCRCGSGGGDVLWWNDTDTSESRSAQSEPGPGRERPQKLGRWLRGNRHSVSHELVCYIGGEGGGGNVSPWARLRRGIWFQNTYYRQEYIFNTKPPPPQCTATPEDLLYLLVYTDGRIKVR